MPVAQPRHLIVLWLIALLLTACAVPEPTPTPVSDANDSIAQADVTDTPEAEPTPTDTPEPPPTDTPTPTATSTSTDTPTPTATPTVTPTPIPEVSPGPQPAVSGTLNVYYLDVGQGDATLLMGPDFTFLIDAGRHDRSDVVPHLERHGVQEIDLLIGTHPHADHIGQMDKVLQRFPVGEVWMSGDDHTTLTYERVIDAIEASDAGYHEPRVGEVYDIGSAVVEVVNPPYLTGDFHEGNVSVRVVYGEIAFMFTGDAESQTEAAMIARGHDLRAHVLQLGHHGSRTSSTRPFLEAVQPEVTIWSASEGNSYGHPHDEVIGRLADMSIPTYGTADFGTIIVTTDGNCYDVLLNGARAPPAAQQRTVNETTELRGGVGTQFDVVEVLDPCTPVMALGRNQTSDWLVIETFDGQQGWIEQAQVQHVDIESLPIFDDPEPSTGVVNGNANLRAGPGTTFDVVGSAAPGTVVTMIERNEACDWLRIEMPTGQQAWIALFLVDEVDVPINGPTPTPTFTPTPTNTPTVTMTPTATFTPTPIPPTPEANGCTPPKVNINTASHEELQAIIHIGPARADQILQLRPFRSVDDMTRISGIAAARLADIKAQGLACVD